MSALRSIRGGKDQSGLVPAHNLEAEEQTVLHAIEFSRDAAIGVGLGLRREHFFDPAFGYIWAAIEALSGSADSTITETTLHEWLRAREWLAKVGGVERLRKLCRETALKGPMRTYVRVVLQLARVRALQEEAHRIAAEGYGDVGDVEEWLEAAPRRLSEQSAVVRAKAPQTIAQTLQTSWELFSRSAGAQGGYATGLPAYDAVTGGLHAGEVLLVSAKEKAGKSTIVGQWFGFMSGQRYPVIGDDAKPMRDAKGEVILRGRATLIFALDSAKQTDWGERIAASLSLVDLEHFRLGTANDADWAGFTKGRLIAEPLHVVVDGEEIGSVGQMGARIRALRDEFAARGIDLCAVAIDYIQLAKGEGQNREQQISNAMRGVIHLAGQKDLAGIAWVVISQTNNEGEIAHCRALAQMCDGWIHLSVDDEKPYESWWDDTARGGEYVTTYPATIEVKRARRGQMGKRAPLISLSCCYKFNFFYGA